MEQLTQDRDSLIKQVDNLAQREQALTLAGANHAADIARLHREIADSEREHAGQIALIGQRMQQLTEERDDLIKQVDDLVQEHTMVETMNRQLEAGQMRLEASIAVLAARANDAESNRLDAYEFARRSADEARGLRRELDLLRRDLLEALDSPSIGEQPIYDHRHRDIVEAMERLFLGTDRTHHIARDPLVDRVRELARLGLEANGNIAHANRQSEQFAALRQDLDQATSELKIQRARAEEAEQVAAMHCRRAETAEAFAEDWHAQILSVRKSLSWRWTKPLRALAKLLR
jgi:hypothetical protein